MQTFGIRDLREKSGELTRAAEAGHLSIFTKRDRPFMVGVPFSENLLKQGVNICSHFSQREHVNCLFSTMLAINLHKLYTVLRRIQEGFSHSLLCNPAAKLAECSLEELNSKPDHGVIFGIEVVNYSNELLKSWMRSYTNLG